ncbi:hypothetical protein JCM9152_4121 [Halalkalibacter hemicellulosilyticusJCM 9152]|uniref:Uncharacterized protein n=1 Tax=Halalkalibacter hemicellulosilyticusJCM 9152 TaxID=1236971 RepID=W4QL05_9BACI|nr:hypothetical protein JCM9152_4121 [Halalkalibacter hemicellulosilyticusJCM 9152]
MDFLIEVKVGDKHEGVDVFGCSIGVVRFSFTKWNVIPLNRRNTPFIRSRMMNVTARMALVLCTPLWSL